MATNTYVALKTYTAPSPTSAVTFDLTGISGYTDLVLVIGSLGMNQAASAGKLRFNGDAGAHYSNTIMWGNGSTSASYRENNSNNIRIYGFNSGPTGSGNNDNVILQIQNYANTTTYKTILGRSNLTQVELAAMVGLWRGSTGSSTEAITSLTITSYNGTDTFTTGTTFNLYGIANADIGALATGGIITYDSTYYYHTFGSNGTFTPKQSLTADVLVVAGGGSGGGYAGGGGGAGGLLAYTSQSLVSGTGYACTIGAGAAGGVSTPGNGTSSQFTSLTAPAGGGYGAIGGGVTSWNASAGGSGGGGGSSNPTASGAAGTSGQGYAGGNGGGAGGNYVGGGGGGSGAVGETAATQTPTTAPSGGSGTSAYSSWVIATTIGEVINGGGYIAGGGGGSKSNNAAPTVTNRSFGGYGGGGRGASMDASGSTLISAEAGKINTGSGGGGGGVVANTNTCASGGSGVIIIRYPKA